MHNAGHIAGHGVLPQEAEEAVRGRHVIIPAAARGGEKRWKLFAKTAAGRSLVVVFTIRWKRLRTVKASTMNASERRRYGAEIDG